MTTRALPTTRMSAPQPTIDLEARTIRATVATRALARDGGILQTENCILDYYRQNPVVQALHGWLEGQMPVVGRCLELVSTATGIDAVTQFADNELGREFAYLYGLNPEKEVFCRGWSFGWRTLGWDWWTMEQARAYVPAELWDDRLADPRSDVWVATGSEMTEYSAVPVGADRHGLSRAHSQGVNTAGRILNEQNLLEAQRLLGELRDTLSPVETQRRAKEFQTLMRDGSSAAQLGDSGQLVAGLRDLAAELKPKNKTDNKESNI